MSSFIATIQANCVLSAMVVEKQFLLKPSFQPSMVQPGHHDVPCMIDTLLAVAGFFCGVFQDYEINWKQYVRR